MRVIAMIACPSVRVSHAGIVSKQLNVGSRKQHHVIVQGVKFFVAKIRWWTTPFPLKFALKVTHPLSNSTISTNIGS